MRIQDFAQEILDLIQATEQETERVDQDYAPDDLDGRIAQGIINYVMLKAKIKELCKEQLAKCKQLQL
jgi:hypothetical protein